MPTLQQDSTGNATDTTEGRPWKVYVAGFLGGLVLAIGDLVTNDTSATVLKFQTVLHKYVFPDFANGGLLGLLLVGTLGALFCWVWPVRSRGDAFVRGFSVFAIVTVGTPYKVTKDEPPFEKRAAGPNNAKEVARLSLISAAFAADGEAQAVSSPLPTGTPVAMVMETFQSGVSSCKPHYWGLLGLGSLINNSVEICESGHDLREGISVKILGCWDTGFRDYRYANIAYTWQGKEWRGWVMTGKGPNYWRYLHPTTESLSRLPSSCQPKTSK